MQATVQPALIDTVGNVPGIGDLFQGPPYGIGMLTAGIILAVMILPFITSITRDVFETVPPMLKEVGLRPRRHDLGGRLEGGAAVQPGRRRSAASCWGWAGRSARRWR